MVNRRNLRVNRTWTLLSDVIRTAQVVAVSESQPVKATSELGSGAAVMVTDVPWS